MQILPKNIHEEFTIPSFGHPYCANVDNVSKQLTEDRNARKFISKINFKMW